jgi:putative protease
MNKKIELLAPAGSFFKAEIALKYGADAIYLGAKQFSLRARATNFELNDIKKIILLAHNKKKKVYIVTNIFCHNNDLKRLKPFLKKIISFNPDGFICSDPYIICMLYKLSNKVNIHISTQQSVTNSKAALF